MLYGTEVSTQNFKDACKSLIFNALSSTLFLNEIELNIKYIIKLLIEIQPTYAAYGFSIPAKQRLILLNNYVNYAYTTWRRLYPIILV